LSVLLDSSADSSFPNIPLRVVLFHSVDS